MAAKKDRAANARNSKAKSKIPPGLKPAKPGEVRNPEGRNQYTYRRDFEANIQKLLKSAAPDAVRNLVPDSARDLVAALGPDATVGEIMAVVTICQGVSWSSQPHVAELLKRLWPATATGTEEDPIHTKPGGLEGVTEETLRDLLKAHGSG